MKVFNRWPPDRRRSLGQRIVSLCLLITGMYGSWVTSACSTPSGTPAQALEAFYMNKGPEETLMDPLILAGEPVVPLVIERIKDRQMPRRRYAIGFLGNGSYKQALPVLQTILQDGSELDYIRADALHSIYQIDSALALKYAAAYKTESNDLGQVSQDLILNRRLVPARRTYREAWLASRIE